jgi:hypothetical protein
MGAHTPAEVEAAVKQPPSDIGPVKPDTKCNATLRGKGKLCGMAAGAGTDHKGVGRCKLHGGASPSYLPELQRLIATQAVEKYGIPIQTDPQTALEEELDRTAGHVAWLRIQVAELEELGGPVGSEGVNDVGVRMHPSYKPDLMLSLYQTERKHLTQVAKACIEAGIEERRVRLAESQGALIAKAITGILKELGVDMTNPQTPKVVRKHLALLEPGEAVAA